MPHRTCPNCNAAVPARAGFCIRCGHPFRSAGHGSRNDPIRVIASVIIFALIAVIILQRVLR